MAASRLGNEVVPSLAPLSTINLLVKSSPPVISLMGGIMMSLTSELTIPVNAAPTMTPIARSRALPLTANSLNSFHMRSVYLTGDDVDKLFGNNDNLSHLLTCQSFFNFRMVEGSGVDLIFGRGGRNG